VVVITLDSDLTAELMTKFPVSGSLFCNIARANPTRRSTPERCQCETHPICYSTRHVSRPA
jgi:hypothetical protein